MRKKWLFVIPVILLVIYWFGPRPETPRYLKTLPRVPAEPEALEHYIRLKEKAHQVKPDNEARIIWNNNSLKQKTAYSIVYLHGFSASHAEGDPVHKNIARRFGCNLFLPRLVEHGIDTPDGLLNLTTDSYWESAQEAFAIAKQLGEKVIMMGTSTGASLALLLAATYPELHALILLSPNIALNEDQAWLLNSPWGLKIAQTFLGSNYMRAHDERAIYKQYWTSPYRIEAVVQLEEFLETSMTRKTFEKVRQPVLTLYYYKDKVHQDNIVKVPAMLTMMDQLGTSPQLKKSRAMPKTGHHVLGSYIKSKDIEGVTAEIENFIKDVVIKQ